MAGPSLRDVLLFLSRQDQEAVNKPHFGEVARKNAENLAIILSNHGWPCLEEYGSDAEFAAWLIAQHADHDPELQERCLRLLKEQKGNRQRKLHIAFLEDRVRMNRGQPQLYGTQFRTDVEGQYVPWAIHDPEDLERRRMEMGLEPFAVYSERLQRYGYEKVKKK